MKKINCMLTLEVTLISAHLKDSNLFLLDPPLHPQITDKDQRFLNDVNFFVCRSVKPMNGRTWEMHIFQQSLKSESSALGCFLLMYRLWQRRSYACAVALGQLKSREKSDRSHASGRRLRRISWRCSIALWSGRTELSPQSWQCEFRQWLRSHWRRVCISQNYFIDAFVNHDAR